MGHTFANITVKGQAQDTFIRYLKKLKINAYVSPSINDFVVIYDEEIDRLSDLTFQISQDFNCLTFAILIDDESAFYYQLFQSGNLMDEYCSSGIDLFPEGGDAQKLCTLLDKKQLINRIRPILRQPSTEKIYLFASQRHRRLVKELGLSIWSTDRIGEYQDIEEEAIDPLVFDEDDFPDVETTLSMLKNTNERTI